MYRRSCLFTVWGFFHSFGICYEVDINKLVRIMNSGHNSMKLLINFSGS